MLVLSRRIGEQVIINDDIVVTVVSIKGNQVRLGFTAPAEVSICREELLAGTPGRAPKREAAGGVHDTVSEVRAPADLRGAGRGST
jgi:carbon storage regulator